MMWVRNDPMTIRVIQRPVSFFLLLKLCSLLFDEKLFLLKNITSHQWSCRYNEVWSNMHIQYGTYIVLLYNHIPTAIHVVKVS